MAIAAASERLPRQLHPGSWWLWALGLAVAATRTTNPLLLATIVSVASLVVSARRTDTPWGRAFRGYLVLAVVILAIRVVFRVLLVGGAGEVVIGRLPEFGLPAWLTGVELGGAVTLEAVLAGLYDGMRLATLVVCVGAANALADPERLLRTVPGALYEAGAVLVVSVSIAPQLAASVRQVRRARHLRGVAGGRIARLRSLIVPVLEDAFERSLRLAAAMDARGYGRSIGLPRSRRRLTGGLVLGGLVGICIGTYGLLDPTGTGGFGAGFLAGGLGAAAAGLWLGGQRVRATRYRPDPWRRPEWLLAGTGVAVAILVVLGGHHDPGSLAPSLAPLRWPELPLVAFAGILLAAAPAILTPPLPAARP